MRRESPDTIVASILEAAVDFVRPGSGDARFEELRLAQGLARALGKSHFRPALVRRGEHLADAELADWKPQPGRVDVAVANEVNQPRFVFELRVDDVERVLWDISKLAALSELTTAEGAYAVTACRAETWLSNRDCVEFFDGDKTGSRMKFDSARVLDTYKSSWVEALGVERSRPLRVGSKLWLTPVGRWSLDSFPGYEMRAVRADQGSEQLLDIS